MIKRSKSAQQGLVPKKSLVTQLMDYFEEVLAAVDFKAAAYFGFVKTFGSVPDSRLITKVSRYGANLDFVDLFPFCPSEISQSMRVKQHFSNTMPVSSEVPLVIIPGYLFVLYIKDISNYNGPIFSYADDSKLAS